MTARAEAEDVATNVRRTRRLSRYGARDGTLPQWVHVIAVEMWMPAEKIMEDTVLHSEA